MSYLLDLARSDTPMLSMNCRWCGRSILLHVGPGLEIGPFTAYVYPERVLPMLVRDSGLQPPVTLELPPGDSAKTP